MEFLGYVAALIMGVILGMLGGGGSILTVPILVYLFHLNPMDATTSSLFIVGATALIASLQAIRKNEVSFASGAQFALASFMGIFISRSLIHPNMPENIISSGHFTLSSPDFVLISFAVLMLLAALAMLRKTPVAAVSPAPASVLKTALYGVAVGAVTGFVGAGGGFLVLPALVNLLGLKMRVAVGTSLAIIAANSLFGFTVSYVQNANVNWLLQITLLALSITGSFAGARLSQNLNERTLKVTFAIFLLLIGSFIILERVAFRP